MLQCVRCQHSCLRYGSHIRFGSVSLLSPRYSLSSHFRFLSRNRAIGSQISPTVQKENRHSESRGKNRNQKSEAQIDKLVAVLKACARQKNLAYGSGIHAHILERGLLEENICLGSSLISLYAKCGMLLKAQEVFDGLPRRDVVCWNALIAGYAQHGEGGKAFSCFRQMQHDDFCPNEVTFLCTLTACSSIGAVDKGQELHAEILRDGLLGKNVLLDTALVDMYAKCGALSKAHEVFDQVCDRNIATWNALISGYSHHGHAEEVFICFRHMQYEGLSPNAITFVCLLKACGSIGAVDKGQEIHAEIDRWRLLERNILVGTALLDMYAKCGAVEKAQNVFGALPVKDLASWNVLITGCAQHGYHEEALNYFDQMLIQGLSPDAVTIVSILKACGSVGAADRGKSIHADIMRRGLVGNNVMVAAALVYMYVKGGALNQAENVFCEVKLRNVVSWNTLVGGYAQHGLGEEALRCFKQMQHEGLLPDAVTIMCTLKACANTGALEKGKEIHVFLVMEDLLKQNALVGTTLLDMYAKCGEHAKAQEVFDRLRCRNLVYWNAVIAGYAQFGKYTTVIELLDRMVDDGVEPDVVTFTVVLNACSNAGLLCEGEMVFHSMNTIYGIIPTVEQYTCMIDLFGRAGHLGKAMEVIERIPCLDFLPVWTALLDACRRWGEVTLGQLAFAHAVSLDENCTSTYLCMRNVYNPSMVEDQES